MKRIKPASYSVHKSVHPAVDGSGFLVCSASTLNQEYKYFWLRGAVVSNIDYATQQETEKAALAYLRSLPARPEHA